MTDDDLFDPTEWIVALRGGRPKHCDFCGQTAFVHPEEGDQWVCESCMRRWGDIPMIPVFRVRSPYVDYMTGAKLGLTFNGFLTANEQEAWDWVRRGAFVQRTH